jgi:hypothetical protein
VPRPVRRQTPRVAVPRVAAPRAGNERRRRSVFRRREKVRFFVDDFRDVRASRALRQNPDRRPRVAATPQPVSSAAIACEVFVARDGDAAGFRAARGAPRQRQAAGNAADAVRTAFDFFFSVSFSFVFVSPSAGGWFARVLECASDAAAADRANRRARGGAAATAAATTAFGRERVRAFETRSVKEQASSFRVFRVDFFETGSNVGFPFARDR